MDARVIIISGAIISVLWLGGVFSAEDPHASDVGYVRKGQCMSAREFQERVDEAREVNFWPNNQTGVMKGSIVVLNSMKKLGSLPCRDLINSFGDDEPAIGKMGGWR